MLALKYYFLLIITVAKIILQRYMMLALRKASPCSRQYCNHKIKTLYIKNVCVSLYILLNGAKKRIEYYCRMAGVFRDINVEESKMSADRAYLFSLVESERASLALRSESMPSRAEKKSRQALASVQRLWQLS